MNKSLSLRRIVRRFVRKLGFSRKIAPDFVDVMKAQNIDIVLDIGANDGDFGREIRDAGYMGLIVSFEPNPSVYSRLEKLISHDPNWIAYPLAVGEHDGFAELSIAVNDTMSSFKSLTSLGEQSGACSIGALEVQVVRLDSFLSNFSELLANIYLKIDTQGFEMEVLRGCGDYLANVKVVQAEIALVHTYSGEMDWLSVVTWLRDRRFEVVTAVCNSAIGPRVREFDFVFLNTNFHQGVQ